MLLYRTKQAKYSVTQHVLDFMNYHINYIGDLHSTYFKLKLILHLVMSGLK